MKVYLDSSALLRWLLGQPGAVSNWGDWEAARSSELIRVESLRTLDRLRLLGMLDDSEVAEKMNQFGEFLGTTDLIPLDKRILERAARSFPTVLGTLDAIHLASALLYVAQSKEELVFLTHDIRLATAAQAFGFQTLGLSST